VRDGVAPPSRQRAQLEEVARAGQFELGQRAQEQLFTRGVYEMIERTELGEELLHGARSADRRRAPPRRAASRTRTSRLDTTTTRAGPINEIGSVMRFIGITLTPRTHTA
jgi:hypothetical protein